MYALFEKWNTDSFSKAGKRLAGSAPQRNNWFMKDCCFVQLLRSYGYTEHPNIPSFSVGKSFDCVEKEYSGRHTSLFAHMYQCRLRADRIPLSQRECNITYFPKPIAQKHRLGVFRPFPQRKVRSRPIPSFRRISAQARSSAYSP